MHKMISLDLQIFSEAGAAAPAATPGDTAAVAVPQRTGKGVNPLSEVKYGIQPEENPPATTTDPTTQTPATDRNAVFEAMIKGDCKDLYDQKVQDVVQRRLRGSKETQERYEKTLPMIAMMGEKYGLQPDEKGNYDLTALEKAILEDDSFFEAEADQRGISVKELKEIKKMERENAELRRQVQERNSRDQANQIYAQWNRDAAQLKTVYPSFDLKTEMANPQFGQLLKAGVDMRTAFEVLHKDEIIPAAMQYTAKTVEQQLSKKLAASQSRPPENGASGQGAAIVKNDVSQLTKADRAEIIRRVQRGERIVF